MKKFKFTLFLVALFIFSFHSQDKIEFSQLTNNVFVHITYKDIEGYTFPSNGLYIVTDEGIIIIDTPWNESQFQPFLDSLEKRHQKKAILSISTHFHDDRTAGIDFFKQNGIKTYSSNKTKDLCLKNKENVAEFTFEKDTVFNFSGTIIETYFPGEGHSPDNIVIYLKNEKILFGGCLVKSTENKNLGNIADANLKDWSKSVENVLKKYKEAEIVVPGHFSWSSNKNLKHTIDLLKKSSK
jgi:metallo-beta-lactamase class B